MTTFSDPKVGSDYTERTARIVLGLRDLHRMAGVLLAEHAPADARILVLGTGAQGSIAAIKERLPVLSPQ
ncbi:hypothetical protein OI450_11765 [Pectobacterium cacticida]|uniref:Uncharacterized protein n=1 Tax=Pectobacterium cacticida TaxID=69221 RepID=A0ABZ2GG86_9GAMM|nr:hypothetical protein [Pectobacterium cacticida]UYX05650.1 hypothetical protein OI450_11765 [Pectobacterium cacticida]